MMNHDYFQIEARSEYSNRIIACQNIPQFTCWQMGICQPVMVIGPAEEAGNIIIETVLHGSQCSVDAEQFRTNAVEY